MRLERKGPDLHTAVLAAAFASALGCGAGPFDGAVYRGNGYSFRVTPVPAGWQRIHVSDAALAFDDAEAGGTIAVHARCGTGEDVPLAALTQHLFIHFTEREILTQEVLPFDGREAMRTVLVAKLDGVPQKFDVVVLKKDGCIYDLVYLASPQGFELGAERFSRFVAGFSVLPPP